MNNLPTAFVLMPFATEFDEIYDYLIRGSLAEAGFRVVRADDMLNQRNIIEDIVQAITQSDLVVADLSTANPNVYYELGLAHAFGKPVVLLAQDIDEVPFDLRSYRVLTYSMHFSRMNQAREELSKLAKEARLGNVQFGSPVSDFATLHNRQGQSLSLIGNASPQQKRDERGILDFQADLEESFEIVSEVIGEVGARLERLTPDIQTTGEQLLNQPNAGVKKQRATVRSLATQLDEYATWLHEANGRYRASLARIGESLNALLSGEFEINDSSRDELQAFVTVIGQVESNAQSGREGFAGLVATMDSLPRIEKEFNRAKQSLSTELKELINNVDQTISVLARARNAAGRFLAADDK
ncbi:hypothetical protein GPA22_04765 [Aromatoleum toluvorans]|uniref:Nucleoside 2-deoxyribosyltransferase n=1 Tax=Aromatoleum toluvorans TaxID=92002 RepID=A0ABX1PXR9_9RHOO|nr:nucleoside 2-deoxyribosyltransferase [Aromatoleum toluvorans]NMG43040.1 hypothetical protein [Aromatoleum toluvorans]